MSEFERIRAELVAWSNPAGMSPSVLLQLEEPLRGALKHIMRRGSATFAELADLLHLSVTETEVIAELLVDCGLLKTSETDPEGRVVYRIRHAKSHRPESPVAIWGALLGAEDEEGG